MAGSYTNLVYHIIFSTKDRYDLIDPRLAPRLHAYIGGIVRHEGGNVLAAGGTGNHLHLLANLPPRIPLSDTLRKIKSRSSAWINQNGCNRIRFAWQAGYGAFSVSESAKADVKAYIQDQAAHHRQRTFKEEYTAFLDRHGIDYDERYIWR